MQYNKLLQYSTNQYHDEPLKLFSRKGVNIEYVREVRANPFPREYLGTQGQELFITLEGRTGKTIYQPYDPTLEAHKGRPLF
jgi:hypothetical protein